MKRLSGHWKVMKLKNIIAYVQYIAISMAWRDFRMQRRRYDLPSCRVAEVGRLLASAKNAFNSFVGRVFANSRQKNVVFSRNTKIATKMVVFT